MKRDLNLIRDILLETEKLDEEGTYGYEIKEYSQAEINYNVWLLIDAGYLNGQVTDYASGGYSIRVKSMTWKGHDYLDAVRNKAIWTKVRRAVEDSFETASLDTVKHLCTTMIEHYLTTKLGL